MGTLLLLGVDTVRGCRIGRGVVESEPGTSNHAPPAMDPQTGRPFGVVYNSHWLREARNRNRMSS